MGCLLREITQYILFLFEMRTVTHGHVGARNIDQPRKPCPAETQQVEAPSISLSPAWLRYPVPPPAGFLKIGTPLDWSHFLLLEGIRIGKKTNLGEGLHRPNKKP